MCAAVWEVAYAASRLRLKALVDKGVADSFTANLAAQARLSSGASSSMLGAISSVGSDKARRRLRPARQRRPVSHQVSPAASTARSSAWAATRHLPPARQRTPVSHQVSPAASTARCGHGESILTPNMNH